MRGTGRVCDVPVGDAMIGRVVDPIGRALDGAEIESDTYYPVERPAPDLVSRRAVDTPLLTGMISIDSLVPIGRGQRELIIGDRQTGKTAVAINAILNQKGKDVICIYCAIGQKASTVSSVIKTLRASGAMDYSVVVAATASDSPAMQYLSPYAACSIGEYFMERGKDVRAMSLLLRRSPGREAYPGDIFYLHSRLLERAACLAPSCGGGTLTALPIIETKGGNISAFIPTNVISITDGQIYLESELFHNGIRPAVNTGLSVSRVGRAAQPQAMRKVSSSLRIELAQYREMAVFSRFGSDLDKSTRKMLESGERLTMLLTQGKHELYSLSEQTALLLLFKNGRFDDVPPRARERSVRSCSTSRIAALAEPALIVRPGTVSPVPVYFSVPDEGGWTAKIDGEKQEELLRAAKEALDAGKIDAIRLSTRPDAIDEAVLARLRFYGVETVELGAQSMDDTVLAASRRGHTAGDVFRACAMVKAAGFRLVLQMMTGLPGDSPGRCVETARRLIRCRPDGVRIYPTVIVKDTELYELWQAGAYREHTVEDAVSVCARIVPLFERAGIPVIRLGLNPTEELSAGAAAAGAYHPALGELVRSRILYDRAAALLRNTPPGSRVVLAVHPSQISQMTGQHRRNVAALREKYELADLRVSAGDCAPGEIRVIAKER